jgi:hypothetical protein
MHNYDHPLFPVDLDLSVLIPDRDALQDVLDAHDRYDDPNEPIILSSIVSLSRTLQHAS